MARFGRGTGAVVAGAALWAALWLGGTTATQKLFPDIADPERPVTHVGLLLGYIGYSMVLSILAGFTTAKVMGTRPMRAVWVLAILQLAFGVVAEVSYWDLLPVWYHLVFLALIVPTTVWGGVLGSEDA